MEQPSDQTLSHDLPPTKEVPLPAMLKSIRYALSRSQGAAILNTSESGIPIDRIAEALSDRYQHATVGEIIDGGVSIDTGKRGLLVSGYHAHLEPSDHRDLQSFIRQVAFERGVVSGRYDVLVVSDGMPSPYVFHEADMPWMNGPFQGPDAVWSVQARDGNSVLVRHRISGSYYDENAAWDTKEEISIS